MSGSCPVSAHICRETAKERDELRRWKTEALPVLDGMQELGKALELPLGSRITGPEALAAVERLTRERDEARAEVARLRAEVGELLEDKSQHFHVTRKIPGATVTEYNDPLVRTSRLRALLNPTEGEAP